MNATTFLKNFAKDYHVGAVTQTSQAVIRKICSKIDFSRDLVIIEYGPGTGSCTLEILRRMTPQSRIIGIEKNRELAFELARTHDPRLEVVQDDVRNVRAILAARGDLRPNVILSSIPFSFFSDATRATLVRETKDVLAPKGTFIVFQYSLLMRKYMEAEFGAASIDFVPLNFPPYFIMEARKN